jgi:hypothetical protein
VALAVSRLITPRLDPLPTAPPGTLDVVPRGAVLVLVAAAVGWAVVGALAAHASGNRINLAESMRDG